MIQEAIALSIVALAAAYLVQRLTGWPLRKKRAPAVLLGARMARGLESARKR